MKQSKAEKQRLIAVASGAEIAPLVLKNAQYVNVFSGELCRDDIALVDGYIAGMGTYRGEVELDYSNYTLLPGFIDGHIHLESSLVTPAQFAKAVIPHGTTTVVTDPHEIANVMGTAGIDYMLQATQGLPLEVKVMLPSCVPATPLDESGAVLLAEDLQRFYQEKRVLGLAEVMDFVSTLAGADAVMDKVLSAEQLGKQVDGHAPGLSGLPLNGYIAAGIGSDHECDTFDNALEKLRRGQYMMIREGTAARNLEALSPLLHNPHYASRCLFCTDDKHPSDLLEKGHMDYIIKKAIQLGVNPITAVQVATLHAAQYFGLKGQGSIAPGYQADLVAVDSLASFQIKAVYKGGKLVYDGASVVEFPVPAVEESLQTKAAHSCCVAPFTQTDFATENPCGLLGLVAGEIISTDLGTASAIDLEGDILKIAVIERHRATGHMGIGYLKGYGLKAGAIATSIAHDSHNIIVVGTNEADMTAAAQQVVENQGGIVITRDGIHLHQLSLSVAGLMSDDSLEQVNQCLEAAKACAFELGVSADIDPFMTLSFLSLPVIPSLRVTTRGVFDVVHQRYVSVGREIS